MPDGYFVKSNDMPQIKMIDGLHRRTMGMTDEVMLCEFFIEAGTQVEPHSHMNDQVGYVLFGQLEMTIGDETRILNPGDSYAIPGGIQHHVKAIIDSLEIASFSPPRQDYRTEAR